MHPLLKKILNPPLKSFCFTVYIKTVPTSPSLDNKTVRIFAYSSPREQSNKSSVARMKTESETGFL